MQKSDFPLATCSKHAMLNGTVIQIEETCNDKSSKYLSPGDLVMWQTACSNKLPKNLDWQSICLLLL